MRCKRSGKLEAKWREIVAGTRVAVRQSGGTARPGMSLRPPFSPGAVNWNAGQSLWRCVYN